MCIYMHHLISEHQQVESGPCQPERSASMQRGRDNAAHCYVSMYGAMLHVNLQRALTPVDAHIADVRVGEHDKLALVAGVC